MVYIICQYTILGNLDISFDMQEKFMVALSLFNSMILSIYYDASLYIVYILTLLERSLYYSTNLIIDSLSLYIKDCACFR